MRTTAMMLLAGLALSGPAAAEPEGGVVWRCWYEEEPQPIIACRLAQAPDPAQAVAEDPRWQRLPGITRELRITPEAFLDRLVVIPMHGPAMDARFTSRLAQGVMCGSRAGCRVHFTMTP